MGEFATSQGTTEILLSGHFLDRFEERQLVKFDVLLQALRDLARAAEQHKNMDVLGMICSRRGYPIAKLVGRLVSFHGLPLRLVALTIMPPDYKHNPGKRIKTIEVGFVGPHRPPTQVIDD